MKSKNATLVGLSAVVLWSAIVGLIRGVSEHLEPPAGRRPFTRWLR
jgi:hypothetical protein